MRNDRWLSWLSILLLVLVGCQSMPTTPLPEPTVAPGPQRTVVSIAPLLADETAAPTGLQIPAIGLEAEITPMGWQVTAPTDASKGERQARWQVPLETVGWHINSARVGMPGTVILSGHHLVGAAVFAPLAAGQVKAGHQILVIDEQGRSFVYEVDGVSEPIRLVGATPEDKKRLNDYLTQSDQPRLVLLTGWPLFADTHYLVITAQLVGQAL